MFVSCVDFMAFKSLMKQKGVAGSGWPDITSGDGRAHPTSMAKAQSNNQQNDEKRGEFYISILHVI